MTDLNTLRPSASAAARGAARRTLSGGGRTASGLPVTPARPPDAVVPGDKVGTPEGQRALAASVPVVGAGVNGNGTGAVKSARDDADVALRAQIDKAMSVAFSAALPDDPPGVGRSLEVRRRHHVTLAALTYASYNPVLREEPVAALAAVALALESLRKRDEAMRDTGLPKGNAQPVPATPAAPSPAAGVMPSEHQALADRVEALIRKMVAEEREFTAPHAEKKPLLKRAAYEYLLRYTPTGHEWNDRFAHDVRTKRTAATITAPQAATALNIWLRSRKPGGAGK